MPLALHYLSHIWSTSGNADWHQLEVFDFPLSALLGSVNILISSSLDSPSVGVFGGLQLVQALNLPCHSEISSQVSFAIN